MLTPHTGDKAQVRTQKEVGRLEQEMAAVSDRMNTHQNDAFRCKQQLEQLKKQMSWNEQQLDQWMVRLEM